MPLLLTRLHFVHEFQIRWRVIRWMYVILTHVYRLRQLCYYKVDVIDHTVVHSVIHTCETTQRIRICQICMDWCYTWRLPGLLVYLTKQHFINLPIQKCSVPLIYNIKQQPSSRLNYFDQLTLTPSIKISQNIDSNMHYKSWQLGNEHRLYTFGKIHLVILVNSNAL